MRKVFPKTARPSRSISRVRDPRSSWWLVPLPRDSMRHHWPQALAPHFTVFAYDRRGRGESGDTPPYAVEREVEDLDALINEAGGSAFVFGHSSGAVLALEAARLLPTKIKKLALYEPPFIIDDSRPPAPEDCAAHLMNWSHRVAGAKRSSTS